MSEKLPIIIDTDIGADPDDALALMLALASPEVEVRGVTIVSGDVRWRGRIAARLLGMAGRADIPIFLGAGELLDPEHQATMLGSEGQGMLDLPYDGPEARIQAMPAADWLIAEARREPFHLVAIGPLTNVAVAMERDPEFRQRLLGVTAMGGLLDVRTQPEAWQREIAQRGVAGWPDYNTTSDPTAALTVARAGSPLTWVTLDVTMRAPLRQAARDSLPDDHPLGLALGRMIDHWQAYWFPTSLPAPYDPSPVPPDAVALLHDPLALASLFAGDWLQLRETRLAYDFEEGIFRMHEAAGGLPGRVAASVDGEAFAAFCMTRILCQITAQ